MFPVHYAAGCEVDHKRGRKAAEPGSRLCAECVSTTRERLAEIPWLTMQTITPPRHDSLMGGRRGKGDRRGMPLSHAALELRSWTNGVLRSWVDLVVSEDGQAHGPGRELAAAARFLEGRVRWLAAHPSAADFVREVGDLHRAALRFLHGSAESRPAVGSCPEPGCDAELSVHTRTDERASVRCANDHRWPVDEWLFHEGERAVRVPRQRSTLPTKAAAEMFGVREATIRQWARRGRLTRYGQPGRAEYDIYELAALVRGRDG